MSEETTPESAEDTVEANPVEADSVESSTTEASTTEAPASEESGQGTAGHGHEDPSGRGARKVRTGIVVSDKMDKTVVVLVERRVKHPKYHKIITRSKRIKAHDETNDAGLGDRVRIVETRPLSKSKRFRVSSVLERAK